MLPETNQSAENILCFFLLQYIKTHYLLSLSDQDRTKLDYLAFVLLLAKEVESFQTFKWIYDNMFESGITSKLYDNFV